MSNTTTTDRKQLRTIAHNLNPVVTLAQKGLTETVEKELQRALNQHELIKIKVMAADREARKELIQAVCDSTGAELVQSIGNVAVLFRPAAKPDPKLSNLQRFKPA